MIASPEEFGKWDLITLDKNLEDLIIKEYNGRMFEEQHEVAEL